MSVHDEIKKNEIIKADTIYRKFKNLVQPLLNTAKSRFTELSSVLKTIKNSGGGDNTQDYFTCKANHDITTPYYDSVTNLNQLEKIYSKLDELEKNWNDILKQDQFDHELDKEHPLHLRKVMRGNTEISNCKDIVPASGKVRKNDYIAAYNFKGFLESLYAIASSLRNIAFNCNINGISYIVGHEDKYSSYKDLNYVKNATANRITNGVSNKSCYNFTDYILNNNTNGKGIKIPYDSVRDTQITARGYRNTPTELFPSDVTKDSLLSLQGLYINKNFSSEDKSDYGRQTVDHLQRFGDAIEISSFYNVPNRTDTWSSSQNPGTGEFNYTKDPTSGIAHQYLTIAPAHNKQGNTLTNFKLNSTTLKPYFKYDSTQPSANKILSTPQKESTTGGVPRQIIKADTVNNLFKELNQLAVKISATLCGEFTLSLNPGNVFSSPSPIGGLGYPMFSAWYFGARNSNTQELKYGIGMSDSGYGSDWIAHPITYTNSDEMDYIYNNKSLILSNGKQIASEAYNETNNIPIRGGMMYFGSKDKEYFDPSDMSNTLKKYTKIIKNAHSSMFPCSYNTYRVYYSSGNKDQISSYKANLLENSLSGLKKTMLTTNASIPFSSSTMEISAGVYNNVYQQMYNRYCVLGPEQIINAYEDDSKASTGGTCYLHNINTKYVFMPYMLWLNRMAHDQNKMYNGTIKDSNNSSINVDISSKSGYLNSAAGIPVLYFPRKHIWTKDYVRKQPTKNGKTFTNIGQAINSTDPISSQVFEGTVQLLLFKLDKNRESKTFYLDIDRDYNVEYIDYLISAACSLNEVINTHPGRTITKFSLNSNSTEIPTIYCSTYSSADCEYDVEKGVKQTLFAANGITSIVNHLKNAYTQNYLKNMKGITGYGNSDLSTQLTSYIDDFLALSYCKRFKFNDFYENYNPCGYSALPKDSIKQFFIASKDNDYVQGNVTRMFSWQTRISTNVNKLPTFKIAHRLYHEHEGDATKVVQGTFAMTGNQTNTIKIRNQEILPTDTDGAFDRKIHYQFVPQPFPIKTTSVYLNYTSKTFVFKGTCKRFWNNLTNISCYLYTSSDNYQKILEYNINKLPSNYNSNRPCSNAIPLSSYVLSCSQNDTLSKCKVTYNTNNDYYNIELSADIGDFQFDNTDSVSCSLRFMNENYGFRDVCKSKNHSFITKNSSFEIKII